MLTWLKSLIGANLAPILSAVLERVFSALRTKRLDTERDQLNRSDAANSAALETQEAVSEAADERT